MKKIFSLVLFCYLCQTAASQTAPALIWHQDYGDPQYNQQADVNAIDSADNFYVSGTVYFGTYGNVITNKYDAFGTLIWNRMYSNDCASPYPDKPLLIYAVNDEQVTVVGYVHRQYTLGHIYNYDAGGNLSSDYFFGDSTLGNTLPLQVSTRDGSGYYLLGTLNGVSMAYKVSAAGNILWSQLLHNNYNLSAGKFDLDPAGNMVAGVFDSATGDVIVRRFDGNSGSPMGAFNTQIDSLVDDTVISIKADNEGNVFLTGTGRDLNGHLQLIVYKFDSLGQELWATLCPNTRGHFNGDKIFLRMDRNFDVLIDGTYNDNSDSLGFASLYKISNFGGNILWSVIDTGFAVLGGALKTDANNNVYLATLKANSDSSSYSYLNFTAYSSDSGGILWNRGFDNGEDNTNIHDSQNSSGDLFVLCTTLLNNLGGWFMCRLGNAANDVLGLKTVIKGANNMEVYPNPFSGSANISFTVSTNQKIRLRIFDVTGQLLDEIRLQATNGDNLIPYTGKLSQGVYLFELEGADFSLVRKAVVN